MGSTHQKSRVSGFHEVLRAEPPIRLREPLAGVLGALQGDEPVIEYSLTDAVRMAGHACPTVTGAWLVCREGLQALYGESESPVRGEIGVTVYGAPDEAVYGVMAQVISLVTGAAPATGFKGLGGRFVRKDLLTFSDEKPDPSAVSFELRRLDTGKKVLVRFYPWAIPFPEEKGRRAGELMERVAAGSASAGEERLFQELWMEKIACMLDPQTDPSSWLRVEER